MIQQRKKVRALEMGHRATRGSSNCTCKRALAAQIIRKAKRALGHLTRRKLTTSFDVIYIIYEGLIFSY